MTSCFFAIVYYSVKKGTNEKHGISVTIYNNGSFTVSFYKHNKLHGLYLHIYYFGIYYIGQFEEDIFVSRKWYKYDGTPLRLL